MPVAARPGVRRPLRRDRSTLSPAKVDLMPVAARPGLRRPLRRDRSTPSPAKVDLMPTNWRGRVFEGLYAETEFGPFDAKVDWHARSGA